MPVAQSSNVLVSLLLCEGWILFEIDAFMNSGGALGFATSSAYDIE